MTITINNKAVTTEAETLLELVGEQGFPQVGVAVAVDNKLVPKGEWGAKALSEGMSIVVVKAACGG